MALQAFEQLLVEVRDEEKYPLVITLIDYTRAFVDPGWRARLTSVLRPEDREILVDNLTETYRLLWEGVTESGQPPTPDGLARATVCAMPWRDRWTQGVAELRKEADRREKIKATGEMAELKDRLKNLEEGLRSGASAKADEERKVREREEAEDDVRTALSLVQSRHSWSVRIQKFRRWGALEAAEDDKRCQVLLAQLVSCNCVSAGTKWTDEAAFVAAAEKEAEWESVRALWTGIVADLDDSAGHGAAGGLMKRVEPEEGQSEDAAGGASALARPLKRTCSPNKEDLVDTLGWAAVQAGESVDTKKIEPVAAIASLLTAVTGLLEAKTAGEEDKKALSGPVTSKELAQQGHAALERIDATEIDFKALADSGKHLLDFSFFVKRATDVMSRSVKTRKEGEEVGKYEQALQSMQTMAESRTRESWRTATQGMRSVLEDWLERGGLAETAAATEMELLRAVLRRLADLKELYDMRGETDRAVRVGKMSGDLLNAWETAKQTHYQTAAGIKQYQIDIKVIFTVLVGAGVQGDSVKLYLAQSRASLGGVGAAAAGLAALKSARWAGSVHGAVQVHNRVTGWGGSGAGIGASPLSGHGTVGVSASPVGYDERRVGVHQPNAAQIVGQIEHAVDKTGAACVTCKQLGHETFECPASFFQQYGKTMPGFNKDGVREESGFVDFKGSRVLKQVNVKAWEALKSNNLFTLSSYTKNPNKMSPRPEVWLGQP